MIASFSACQAFSLSAPVPEIFDRRGEEAFSLSFDLYPEHHDDVCAFQPGFHVREYPTPSSSCRKGTRVGGAMSPYFGTEFLQCIDI